jgi:hypothetical protein
MRRGMSSLSNIISQLINPTYTYRTSPMGTCAYKGCNNPRHIAKTGNIWKKCKECATRENKLAQAKRVKERLLNAKLKSSI